MARAFDGMATRLNRAFGGVVTIDTGVIVTSHDVPVTSGGDPVTVGADAIEVRATFREQPEQVLDGELEGGVIAMVATLSVPKDLVAAHVIVAGNLVAPGNGETYRLCDPIPSGSPAADAFVVFPLTRLS